MGSNLKTSLVTYALLLLIVYLVQRRLGTFNRTADVVCWLIAILIVLFGSPLAWAMSMVWLLPILVLPIYYMDKLYHKQLAVSLGLILIAFFLILIPDRETFSLAYTDNFKPLMNKYILAEVLLLVSLLAILANSRKIESLVPAAAGAEDPGDDRDASPNGTTGRKKQHPGARQHQHYGKKRKKR